MHDYLRRLFDLQLFATDGAGGDGNTDDTGGDTGDGDQTAGDGGDTGKGDVKTMTQAEIDAMIEKRLARAKKQWESDAEAEREREQMTEVERLKAEKDEAERKAQEAQSAANRRLINAEAKVQAVALGVKPERVAYALRLADLSEVAVDDNGDPDAGAIKAAIETVIKDLPELKGTQGPSKSGSEFNGGNNTDKNPWSKEHFNLTEQGRIMRENPDLAARLKQEAKGK